LTDSRESSGDEEDDTSVEKMSFKAVKGGLLVQTLYKLAESGEDGE